MPGKVETTPVIRLAEVFAVRIPDRTGRRPERSRCDDERNIATIRGRRHLLQRTGDLVVEEVTVHQRKFAFWLRPEQRLGRHLAALEPELFEVAQ